jgi:hypothetical protein
VRRRCGWSLAPPRAVAAAKKSVRHLFRVDFHDPYQIANCTESTRSDSVEGFVDACIVPFTAASRSLLVADSIYYGDRKGGACANTREVILYEERLPMTASESFS